MFWKKKTEKTQLKVYLMHSTEIILRNLLGEEFESWRASLPDLLRQSIFLVSMYASDYRAIPIPKTNFDVLVRVGPIDGANRREKGFMLVLVVPRRNDPVRKFFLSPVSAKQIFPLSKFDPTL